ncbi:MAG TPA: hypothetical protein VFU22_32295, partial [Roseiflexaceae bacterium]|nr:hypothetical protein [Roseiflexaceae bacterium]
MRRHSALALLSIIGGLFLALGSPLSGPASIVYGSTKETNGYSDFSHAGVGLPTADKPQSKLWYNDGRWW